MKQIDNNEQEYIVGITDVVSKLIAGNEHISIYQWKKLKSGLKTQRYMNIYVIHQYLFMKRVQKTFMKCM